MSIDYLSRCPSRLLIEGTDPQSIVNAISTHDPLSFIKSVLTLLLLFYFRLVIVMELVQKKTCLNC